MKKRTMLEERPAAWLDYDPTDRPGELWRDIRGYEGMYQISTEGRVKSLKYGKVKIIKPGVESTGYLHVMLSKGGHLHPYKIHRLVADAFLPNLLNLRDVNHLDEIKSNNAVSNLEWCSRRENNVWGSRRGELVEVDAYDLDGRFIGRFSCLSEASRMLGVYVGNISGCMNGRVSQTGGYCFRKVDHARMDVKSRELF